MNFVVVTLRVVAPPRVPRLDCCWLAVVECLLPFAAAFLVDIVVILVVVVVVVGFSNNGVRRGSRRKPSTLLAGCCANEARTPIHFRDSQRRLIFYQKNEFTRFKAHPLSVSIVPCCPCCPDWQRCMAQATGQELWGGGGVSRIPTKDQTCSCSNILA